jgi:hypothetical protein
MFLLLFLKPSPTDMGSFLPELLPLSRRLVDSSVLSPEAGGILSSLENDTRTAEPVFTLSCEMTPSKEMGSITSYLPSS